MILIVWLYVILYIAIGEKIKQQKIQLYLRSMSQQSIQMLQAYLKRGMTSNFRMGTFVAYGIFCLLLNGMSHEEFFQNVMWDTYFVIRDFMYLSNVNFCVTAEFN